MLKACRPVPPRLRWDVGKKNCILTSSNQYSCVIIIWKSWAVERSAVPVIIVTFHGDGDHAGQDCVYNDARAGLDKPDTIQAALCYLRTEIFIALLKLLKISQLSFEMVKAGKLTGDNQMGCWGGHFFSAIPSDAISHHRSSGSNNTSSFQIDSGGAGWKREHGDGDGWGVFKLHNCTGNVLAWVIAFHSWQTISSSDSMTRKLFRSLMSTATTTKNVWSGKLLLLHIIF